MKRFWIDKTSRESFRDCFEKKFSMKLADSNENGSSYSTRLVSSRRRETAPRFLRKLSRRNHAGKSKRPANADARDSCTLVRGPVTGNVDTRKRLPLKWETQNDT